MSSDIKVGSRVHHRGGIYSRSWDPELGEGGSYWGTVIEIDPREFSDGSKEYLIAADDHPLPGCENKPRWWASYHIDRVLA